MPPLLRALSVALAAVFLALAGCGDGSEEDEIREVAAEYLEASADADPEACELMSESQRAGVELRGVLADRDETCEQLVSSQELLDDFGAGLRAAAEEAPEAEVELEDEHALVVFPESTAVSALLLVKDRGSWKVDDTDF